MRFATGSCVLHLDLLALPTPQIPRRRRLVVAQAAASVTVHATMAALVLAAEVLMSGNGFRSPLPATEPTVQHIVFVMPESSRMGGGGGGGGNQQTGPLRRAQSIGTEMVTLRVREAPPPAPAPVVSRPSVEESVERPALVLDVKPLVSGFFEQTGSPTGGMLSAPSLGPGSGGGVGSGSGTGIGAGRGPGLGPGVGGGTGGGVYRPGGPVTWPRLIREVRPIYTTEALRNRLQGTVVLEAIITEDGCASQIRVIKSLDRGGLDEQAIAAVAQWEFEPGRLAGAPVNVLVRVMVDFRLW